MSVKLANVFQLASLIGDFRLVHHALFVVFSEFGDCCGLYAKDGKNKCITSKDELTLVMRSLGFSPTADELDQYYERYGKGEGFCFGNTRTRYFFVEYLVAEEKAHSHRTRIGIRPELMK